MSIDTYFCFCCLSTNDLTNMFSNDSDANYGKDIFQLFHLNISYEDYEYDGYICDDCTKRLKEAVQFKEQVFDVLNILQSNGLIEIKNEDQQVIVKKVAADNTDTEKKCENIIVTDTITIKLAECPELQSPIKKESEPTTETQIERDKPIQPAEKKEKQITRYEVTKDLKCEVCSEELPNAYVYHSHMNQHFPNHICEACGKGFLTERRLKRHMQSHKIGLFNCQSGDAKFTNCNSLNSHRQRKHSAVELYACPRCPARFGTLTRRARHLARAHAHQAARHRCPYCPRLFILRGNLSSHMLNTHQKVKRHWCGECGAGFFQRQELVAHSASHTAQYQFHCHHCPKRYARKKALVVHMRTHTDERRFSCEVCGKRFIQKCTLLAHLKIHNRTADKSTIKDK